MMHIQFDCSRHHYKRKKIRSSLLLSHTISVPAQNAPPEIIALVPSVRMKRDQQGEEMRERERERERARERLRFLASIAPVMNPEVKWFQISSFPRN
jgi:hypothetical protein